jgi:very-short-patch-repair endonuclease
VRGFVVDFCCHKARLVVEVDGPSHEESRDYDEQRSRVLAAEGYNVIRFSNNEVLCNLRLVMLKILRAIGLE